MAEGNKAPSAPGARQGAVPNTAASARQSDRPNTASAAPQAIRRTAEQKPAPRPRARVLDVARGVSLLSMLAYHTMFDLVAMFGVYAPWYFGLPGFLWQQSICWTFILVSGASMRYGGRPARRGLIVFGCAMVLTVATLAVMPDMLVAFGVLHFMGAGMLFTAALQKPFARLTARGTAALATAAGVSFLLFAALYGVPGGYVGFFGLPLAYLPDALYSTRWLFWLGLPGPSFYSSDYFPLVPWLFLFWTGYFAFACVKSKVRLGRPGKNPLEWAGRHTLPIYMAHQPVIYGACLLLQRLGVL